MPNPTREERMDKDGFFVSSRTFITNRRTCVSVKISDAGIQVRNTKDSTKTTLMFSRDEWEAFLVGAKAGEFDA